VCESVSQGFGKEKKEKPIPVEEKSANISGEGKNKSEIAAEEENKNILPVEESGEIASPVALKVESVPSTPKFPENVGSNAIVGGSVAQVSARGSGGTDLRPSAASSSELNSAATLRSSDANHRGDLSYTARDTAPERLAEIWEAERGSLPELRAMTPERVVRCRARLRNAARGEAIAENDSGVKQFLGNFREAVRRAAATPFLCGSGPAGWRANFDWMIANDTNYLKVLEGRYDSGDGSRNARDESVRRELRAGTGPSIEYAALHATGSAEGHSPGAYVMQPAMRADVVERFRRRGQANASQRLAQS
jgi:hypothetical protein